MYRKEAVSSQYADRMGGVVLSVPTRLRLLGLIIAFAAIYAVGLFFTASFTKRVLVTGVLALENGPVKVFSPSSGIIIESAAHAGEEVTKGEKLFVLSLDNPILLQMHEGGGEAESSQYGEPLEESVRKEYFKIKQQIHLQKDLVKRAESSVDRFRSHVKSGLISADTLEEKQVELIGHNLQLRSLEREEIRLQRTLAPQKLVITAPESGKIAAQNAYSGQTANPDLPLLTILPANSRLIAEFYVSSGEIGFIAAGDTVRLRYHSFPFQKFGTYDGTIRDISGVAIVPQEVVGSGGYSNSDTDPQYKVVVQIQNRFTVVDGKRIDFIPGMLVDVDIVRETRTLFEWIFQPLTSLNRE